MFYLHLTEYARIKRGDPSSLSDTLLRVTSGVGDTAVAEMLPFLFRHSEVRILHMSLRISVSVFVIPECLQTVIPECIYWESRPIFVFTIIINN